MKRNMAEKLTASILAAVLTFGMMAPQTAMTAEAAAKSTLEKDVQKLVKKSKAKKEKTQKKKLKKLFQYVEKNYGYARAIGFKNSRGWEKTFTAEMIKNKKGSCYHFAALYAFLAKESGVEARICLGRTNGFNKARKRLQQILERADCKKVRFHDLRHTFATMSLEHGMDVKTLSAIIGHVSAKTTLNIYTHITNEMQENAAASIDRGIAKAEISRQKAEAASEAQRFEPYTPPRRRPGTGYIKQLKEDLWEGRYSPVWPDGKKHSRNVYGRTREECEEKLAKLILQMKAEIAVLRNGTAAEYPDGVSPKKKQLAEYLRQHPGVSNKSYIARETGMDRTTVQKYYDEVRAELAAPANT